MSLWLHGFRETYGPNFCSPKLESRQPSCMRGGNLSSEVHSLDLVLAFLTIHRSWISCPCVILPMCCTSFWQSSIKRTSSCLKHKPQAKIVPACCMDILLSCSTAPGKRHATSAGCPVQRVLWRDSDSDRISYNTSATFNQIPFWRKTHVHGVFPKFHFPPFWEPGSKHLLPELIKSYEIKPTGLAGVPVALGIGF